MTKGIRGKLLRASYKNCLLSGSFEDYQGNKYDIINAKGSICQLPNSNRILITFYKDNDNCEQDYLDELCLSIKIQVTQPFLSWKLNDSDFLNQEETYIFIKENSDVEQQDMD